MTGEPIRLPNEAYSAAEQAARQVTEVNATEYGTAGMRVGARYGGIGELRILIADIELYHGVDDPVATRARERLAELDANTAVDYPKPDTLEAIRRAVVAGRKLDPAIGYPIADMFREMYSALRGGFGYSWGLTDAAQAAAEAIVTATANPS